MSTVDDTKQQITQNGFFQIVSNALDKPIIKKCKKNPITFVPMGEPKICISTNTIKK